MLFKVVVVCSMEIHLWQWRGQFQWIPGLSHGRPISHWPDLDFPETSDTLRLEGKNVADVRWKQMSTKDEFDRRHHHFPREYCSPRRAIKKILPDGHNGGEEIMHAQKKIQCNSRSLWLYRRRCGSRSLVGCGLLRSYSGVYLGSSPIRGSGAVLAG